MSIPQIGPEDASQLAWSDVTDALQAGHALPKAQLADVFLGSAGNTLLSRAALVEGLGSLVKTATVWPGNAAIDRPSVNGVATLFSDTTGEPEAVIDFHLLTRLKTAGDSLLAAKLLAPQKVQRILIIGAGTVARSLVSAYRSVWPAAEFAIWNRTAERARELAVSHDLEVVGDLGSAVSQADIVSCATMSATPILKGAWLRPGQHVDLIGAFRPDMREADDACLRRARIFVDSYETTLDHIGELKIPIEAGTISRSDVVADFYRFDHFTRADDDITLFKNGGGAHLDLMTARALVASVHNTRMP